MTVGAMHSIWATRVICGEIVVIGGIERPPANLEVLVGRWAPARPSSRFWLSGKASTSLAQLWAAQGRHAEAYDLLAPAYGWFTEGFDTADLKDAKKLLEELTKNRESRNCCQSNVLKSNTNSFRACVSATQEELQTWGLLAID
jgi:hypothetical protein